MARSLAVMIVEDEALIGMAIADMLVDLGHNVAAEAANIEDATSYAMTANYDLAILDINLQADTSTPRRSHCATRQTVHVRLRLRAGGHAIVA